MQGPSYAERGKMFIPVVCPNLECPGNVEDENGGGVAREEETGKESLTVI